MAESTEVHDQVHAPAAVTSTTAPGAPGAWAKFKWGLQRTVLWSYERGSWQYDIIVAAILAFIFLTPRSWFQRDPNLGMVDLRHVQGVVEIAHEKTRHTYVVDARLVQSRAPQTPEDAVHDILHERLGHPYKVVSVEPVRDHDGVVLSFRAVVEQ
jgi:hypothetical protein